MSCRTCKFYLFMQNDMLGACKLYPTVVNKSPTDWCGQQIPAFYESEDNSITLTVENTDAVKPKRGRKNAREQK